MAAQKVRVGVIGAGRMGERHCRVYSTLAGVEFVGVSDLSRPRGESVAASYEVQFFQDYRDLLARVDAVSIATPTLSHFAVASDCLRNHLHVLVEKPLTEDVEEARELLRLGEGHPGVLQVGHIERFNPVFLELRSILEEVPLIALNVRRLSPFDTSNTDVDVVFDLMIHDVDLALALLGDEVRCIHAHGRSARTGGADYAVASICFESGPIATLASSRITEQKVRQLEITGLGAYIEADLLNKSISIYRRMLPEYLSNHQKPLRYRQEGLVERIHIPTAEPLMLELQHFVQCVRQGCRPAVTGEDGLRALEIVTEIRGLIARDQTTSLMIPGMGRIEAVPKLLDETGFLSRVQNANVA